MLNINLITCILLCQAFALTTALGTMGDSGNQWNQNPHQQHNPQQTKGPLGGWDDEVSNPKGDSRGDTSKWGLEHSIPGIPGQSYPNYRDIPDTSFDCGDQKDPGYYADMEARCQVYHICQAGGRQNSFLCPVGTIFNQETFVCDWWFNVNCADTPMYISKNRYLFRGPHIGIDGSNTNIYRRQQEQGTKGNARQPAVGIPNLDSQDKGGNLPPTSRDQSQGHWQQGRNYQGSNLPSRDRDQSQGHRQQGGNQRKGNWPSQVRDQFKGHRQQGGNQGRGNWPSQVRDQFKGQGQQGGYQTGDRWQSQGPDHVQGHRQQGENQKGGNWQSQGRDQFQGPWTQGGNQKGGTWPSHGRDQSQGQWQQGGKQEGGNWPGQGRDQFQGQRRQGGNQKGGNWQSNNQDQSQGQWRQGGNQKGDNRPTNGFTGGQNWQNRVITNMGGHQGRGSFGGHDKGPARRQSQLFNMDWKQQGDHPKSGGKGGIFQQGPTGRNNPNWNQKGHMAQRNEGGIKRGLMQPNIPNDLFRNTGTRRGSDNRRVGPNSSKGFDANRWSLRPQNFQTSSQDRKGSSSETWQRNDNLKVELQKENVPPFSSEWQDSNADFKGQTHDTGSLENRDWSIENEKFSLTKRDVDEVNQLDQSYNSGSEQAWESDANGESEVSLHERDHDYD